MRVYEVGKETNSAEYIDYAWINDKPEYVLLKIKVLDCRSNDVVTNARVK